MANRDTPHTRQSQTHSGPRDNRVTFNKSGQDYGSTHGNNGTDHHQTNHHDDRNVSNHEPRYQYEHQGWKRVHRSWDSPNEEMSNPTFNSGNGRQHQTSPSHQDSSATMDRLTSSRLQNLNQNTAPRDNMQVYMNQIQRDGVWDGVGWVKQRDHQ